MGTSTIRRLGLIVGVALLLLPACDGDTFLGVPVATVSGQASLLIGGQTQLAVTTTNGTDTSYTWGTSDGAIATVDATGMVTGRLAGEAMITATGNQTGAVGMFPVVVAASPPVSPDVPFYNEWRNSAHGDETAEAFVHWDDDGEVPTSCARCHSTGGFRDYLGADGTDPFVVDNPAPLGTTIECSACHNDAAAMLSEVTFPSGVTISDLGREALCMTCHQGRASKDSVDTAIANAMPANDDAILPDQGFINVHYFPAAATRYGGQVRGGYLYDDKHYDVYFQHVPGLDKCQNCHEPHTQEIKLGVCAQCHSVSVKEDLYDIRMESSITRDYDGDGNLSEGLWFEIDGLRTLLLATIRNYAREVLAAPIAYDSHSYPYFFADANDNGIGDAGEGRYTTFSSRLLKATFNYQYGVKDPGGFAHNGKFIIQLLHDSIADLNAAAALATKTDMAAAMRDDVGHFDGTAEAFRHWDEDGEVSASCTRCHSGSFGYKEFLTYGATTDQPIANGMDCATCHTTFDTFETRRIESVSFRSGLSTPEIDDAIPTNDLEVQSNMCITCHQGRTSKKDIDDAIAANSLGFLNVHYLAAAATLFGTDAKIGYEYDGKDYMGKFQHAAPGSNTNNCTFCHSPPNTKHTFLPQDNLALCNICHQVNDVKDIRLARPDDYDGDGDADERLDDEIGTMRDALYAAIQARALLNGFPIIYETNTYPYFFRDTNLNGEVDPGEANFGNRYRDWTPALMKAAHNFQHSLKEPGAWAHNFFYVLQLLYDSIEDLGGDVSGYTVPDRGP